MGQLTCFKLASLTQICSGNLQGYQRFKADRIYSLLLPEDAACPKTSFLCLCWSWSASCC